jgi:hypothetical protein
MPFLAEMDRPRLRLVELEARLVELEAALQAALQAALLALLEAALQAGLLALVPGRRGRLQGGAGSTAWEDALPGQPSPDRPACLCDTCRLACARGRE